MAKANLTVRHLFMISLLNNDHMVKCLESTLVECVLQRDAVEVGR